MCKAFDAIYGRLIHADMQTMMDFPTGFYGMGLVYTVLGLTVPILTVYLARRVK